VVARSSLTRARAAALVAPALVAAVLPVPAYAAAPRAAASGSVAVGVVVTPCLQAPVDPVRLRHAARVLAGHGLARLRTQTATIPLGRYPSTLARGSARWTTTGPRSWTSGFMPTQAWLVYGLTGSHAWRVRAARVSRELAATATTTVHDVGFMVGYPASLAWSLTRATRFRDDLRRAVVSLDRHWVPGAQANWAWAAPPEVTRVIPDTLPNLRLVWAARAAGVASASSAEHARLHARTVVRTHVRVDGSTRHVVDLDSATGTVIEVRPGQGWSTTSTWTRGQAWAMVGLTEAYAATGDPDLLAAARSTSRWWLTHTPSRCVPWSDADGPRTARDTSAAAVAAVALLELARLDPDAGQRETWRRAGAAEVVALSQAPWLAPRGPALLAHGAVAWTASGVSVGTTYGDAFALEAAARVLGARPFGAATPLRGTRAAG
jgi:unsaturated chondroitin disaccharide hydrolase